MRERRCFVQFIHPGGEHSPNQGDSKGWNPIDKPHKRKFLQSPGHYLDRNESKVGDMVFWGEWEPESRVLTRYSGRAKERPRYLYKPFFVDHGDGTGLQNTDPFVFGERFHYTGCLQHTRKGPTQMRFLERGSLVLFGSCRERSHFVLDTVFVTGEYVDHSATDWERKLDGRVSDTYRTVTIQPWYRGKGREASRKSSPAQGCSIPDLQSHRLYFGATPANPVEGMFSFFPCQPHRENTPGFARPRVQIPRLITPNLIQGKKIARDLSLTEIRGLWDEVVRQIKDQGLCLGTHAELPERSPSEPRPSPLQQGS